MTCILGIGYWIASGRPHCPQQKPAVDSGMVAAWEVVIPARARCVEVTRSDKQTWIGRQRRPILQEVNRSRKNATEHPTSDLS
ncbi:uncharacterized protein LOC123500360 isoform X2 [Portunus trituberculatus]|uniref:uncharacterized protein LOC123500360 isoform X2 n=1 Tax=Portunus trituberculatus TaxID=210409 RepID=UPI001E1CF228|nr:uncharacterized protein LOC123500360 isoform X2 [Portunus trituberculatus]